jgi:hypothetical protein
MRFEKIEARFSLRAPIGMGKPAATLKALRRRPLVEASGTNPPRIERIP